MSQRKHIDDTLQFDATSKSSTILKKKKKKADRWDSEEKEKKKQIDTPHRSLLSLFPYGSRDQDPIHPIASCHCCYCGSHLFAHGRRPPSPEVSSSRTRLPRGVAGRHAPEGAKTRGGGRGCWFWGKRRDAAAAGAAHRSRGSLRRRTVRKFAVFGDADKVGIGDEKIVWWCSRELFPPDEILLGLLGCDVICIIGPMIYFGQFG